MPRACSLTARPARTMYSTPERLRRLGLDDNERDFRPAKVRRIRKAIERHQYEAPAMVDVVVTRLTASRPALNVRRLGPRPA